MFTGRGGGRFTVVLSMMFWASCLWGQDPVLTSRGTPCPETASAASASCSLQTEPEAELTVIHAGAIIYQKMLLWMSYCGWVGKGWFPVPDTCQSALREDSDSSLVPSSIFNCPANIWINKNSLWSYRRSHPNPQSVSHFDLPAPIYAAPTSTSCSQYNNNKIHNTLKQPENSIKSSNRLCSVNFFTQASVITTILKEN